MQNLVYRFATLADVPALVRLRVAFLTETGSDLTPQPALAPAIQAYFLETIATGEFLGCVAESEGQLAATSGLIFRRNPPSIRALKGRSAYVMNMYTLPAWRRRGIAGELLKRLVNHARTNGCRHISLHTMPGARGVYERVGFKATDNEMRLNLNSDAEGHP